MSMRRLIAEAETLFPLREQHDARLWQGLAAAGLVARKRGGRSYDEILPREIAAFLLGRLASDGLTEALKLTPELSVLPGFIRNAPREWLATAGLPEGITSLDCFEAIITDFAAGRADNAHLKSAEICFSSPYPMVTIGLAGEWRSDKAMRRKVQFAGMFAREIEWPDEGDYVANADAIDSANAGFAFSLIRSARSIPLDAVRYFAKAVITPAEAADAR